MLQKSHYIHTYRNSLNKGTGHNRTPPKWWGTAYGRTSGKSSQLPSQVFTGWASSGLLHGWAADIITVCMVKASLEVSSQETLTWLWNHIIMTHIWGSCVGGPSCFYSELLNYPAAHMQSNAFTCASHMHPNACYMHVLPAVERLDSLSCNCVKTGSCSKFVHHACCAMHVTCMLCPCDMHVTCMCLTLFPPITLKHTIITTNLT